MKNYILFVAGGSGGHITPAIAVALKLNKKDVFFICSKSDLDKNIIKKYDFKYKQISTGKLRRYFDWQNFLDIGRLSWGLVESFLFLVFNRPRVIFSKGGFVSLPVGISAFLLRIPFVLHESDSIMGLANRILSRLSNQKLSAFQIQDATEVGTPIRQDAQKADPKKANDFLNFKYKKPILLVIGGSQGSSFINNLIKNQLKNLKSFNIVIIKGKNQLNLKNSDSIRIFDFLYDEFFDVLNVSDFVISRSGANSIAEIAYFKKPAILIPLKNSANNHQYLNAKNLQKQKLCLMLTEDEVEKNLQKTIKKLQENKELFSKNISKLSSNESAEKIAKIIKKYI
jgi:UDP-N-acetylglucosamine--N-acetylmuramyl-(pentapeptide) pyrophosphoryl-undecaprenol N-acetylglucosamine transferase